MLKLVKVRGMSMHPTFAPGDYLICTKARSLRSGFVVVVDHSELGTIVKRIKSIEAGKILLVGDGAGSTSTETIGAISCLDIKGRVRLAITSKGIRRI